MSLTALLTSPHPHIDQRSVARYADDCFASIDTFLHKPNNNQNQIQFTKELEAHSSLVFIEKSVTGIMTCA